jgi:RHS repeat-associated protein
MNREWDEEIGLYYYRARYYDAYSGRFMQEDPHPGEIENPATVNSRYIYVLNNPYSYADPKGEFLVELLVLTLVQTAIQAAMQNGSFWENFANSFSSPGGGGRGKFWTNLFVNSIAMGLGMTPGLNMQTGIHLGVAGISADMQDKQERDGYNSNWLGMRVGVVNDIYKIGTAIYAGYSGYRAWQDGRLKELGENIRTGVLAIPSVISSIPARVF